MTVVKYPITLFSYNKMPFVNTYCIFFVASYVSSLQVDKVTYGGAQVWRTVLRNRDDMILIKRLVFNQDVSIWRLNPNQADFLVPGDHKVKVYRQLRARKLSHAVLIMDVQRKIDTQPVAPSMWTDTTLRVGHRLNWKKFPSLNVIDEFYHFINDDYSSICKVQAIGHTAENRTIKMINITNGNPDNKVILVIAGQHAREWISITSALYIVDVLVTKFDKQHSYIQNINWLIIPVSNPDGYVYTHSTDRLWRKNRRKFMRCQGVDINRNFDVEWDTADVSENNECKEIYSGPYPFSEAESLAIRNVIRSSKTTLIATLDLHAYGNLILFPWSSKSRATSHHEMHRQTAKEMSRAIFKSTKSNYTVGATYHTVYPATGTPLDWAYAYGVPHSYVIESRDNGKFGFLLPPEEIEETGKEMYIAVKYLAKAISQKHDSNNNNQSWF